MMRRVAVLSLVHDRGKFVGAVAGVAFAATLVLLQLGIYAGFLQVSALLVGRLGGDLWVMARNTEVIDNGEPLSAGTRARIRGVPGVRDVRGLVFAFTAVRKKNGALDAVQVVGAESDPARVIPWELASGLPDDLRAPMRVSVDETDLAKLHLPRDPRGESLEIGGQTVTISAVTRGIRAFTLTPYVFADIATARRLIGLPEGQAHYFVVDLEDPTEQSRVARAVEMDNPDVQVLPQAVFRTMTETYWVAGSGAGAAIAFCALLGLVVGVVIVGQTLYALTREHEKELATLKALGATGWELASFVGIQAGILAVLGSALGLVLSFIGQHFLAQGGLVVVLSTEVLLAAGLAVLGMCALASIGSLRKVLTLDAAEVFR